MVDGCSGENCCLRSMDDFEQLDSVAAKDGLGTVAIATVRHAEQKLDCLGVAGCFIFILQ